MATMAAAAAAANQQKETKSEAKKATEAAGGGLWSPAASCIASTPLKTSSSPITVDTKEVIKNVHHL